MTMVTLMKSEISKSRFKARALEFFREIEATGTSVIITDHGKPTLEVRRFRDRTPLETLKGSVIRYEGATQPVADDEWENVR